VADSQAKRLQENIQAIKDLYEDLEELGFDPRDVPLILQCNKRDLQEIMPVHTIKESMGLNGVPTYESVAVDGVGVLDSLKTIINEVVARARGKIYSNPA